MAVTPSRATTVDPTSLRQDAYPDSRNLSVRRGFFAHRHPPIDLPQWALDLIGDATRSDVLDVGCGPGTYIAKMKGQQPAGRAIGVDLSWGMVSEARRAGVGAVRPVGYLTGDAQHLPFGQEQFDLVLAAHILFHVPDLPLALAELRRILRPEGQLAVIINGPAHLAELSDLVTEVAGQLWPGRPNVVFPGRGHRFSAWMRHLEEHFVITAFHRTAGTISVSTTTPVVEYLRSIHAWLAPQLPEPLSWPQLEQAIGNRLGAEIDQTGRWSTEAEAALFIGRRRR